MHKRRKNRASAKNRLSVQGQTRTKEQREARLFLFPGEEGDDSTDEGHPEGGAGQTSPMVARGDRQKRPPALPGSRQPDSRKAGEKNLIRIDGVQAVVRKDQFHIPRQTILPRGFRRCEGNDLFKGRTRRRFPDSQMLKN